jgi:hypothetical protein
MCDKNGNVTISKDGFQKGKCDMQELLSGKTLTPTLRSVRRFRSVAVDSAITFILSSENVSFFSWGTKRWKVDGVEKFFPAVSRKTTRANMYCKYIATQEIPEVNKVKRSSFL